jgi:hypothetical protein
MNIINGLEWRLPYKISILQTDNKTTLNAAVFTEFIKGRHWDKSPARVHQPNSSIERANRILIKRARCLRIDSGLFKYLLPEIVRATADLLNLTPIKRLN